MPCARSACADSRVCCSSLRRHAGLYSPDESFNFEIGADGIAKPIQFAGGFESIIGGLREIAQLPRTPDEPLKEARREALARVQQRKTKGSVALSSDELAGLGADLIRLNRPEEALNLLQPLARDPRRGGFLAYTHLARAHAGRGEWGKPATSSKWQFAIQSSPLRSHD